MSAPSGKFVLRVPPTLHQHLKEAAEKEGVSLNHIVVSMLAYQLGRKEGEADAQRQRRESVIFTSRRSSSTTTCVSWGCGTIPKQRFYGCCH
jgi:hypothetical protein